jgi:hypothetical protein
MVPTSGIKFLCNAYVFQLTYSVTSKDLGNNIRVRFQDNVAKTNHDEEVRAICLHGKAAQLPEP